ncbi:MAG: trypsin-like peptidase domain-containing protein, partial [Waterburya sp.]
MKDCNLGLNLAIKLGICSLAIILLGSSDINSKISVIAQEARTRNLLPTASRNTKIYQLCQAATVRVIKADSAGSGVIINREGNIYSVLTNWHVVDSTKSMILTMDGQQHHLVKSPQQLGDVDLAVLQFYSKSKYPTAEIETEMPHVGDTVYAAGFPLAIDNIQNSLRLGNKAFRLTQGEVSIIPLKSLPQGYQLGYTND